MLAMGDAFTGSKDVVYQFQDYLGMNEFIQSVPFAPTQTAAQRHKGFLNLVFCDGHVESLKVRTLFSRSDDCCLRRWNNDGLPHRELLR